MPNVNALSSGNFDDTGYSTFNANATTARNSTNGIPSTAALVNLGHGKVFTSTVVYRYAVAFDLGGNDADGSSISGNTVTSAQLIIKTAANLTGFSTGTANTSNTVYLAKMDSSEYGSEITDGGSVNDIDGWVSSGTYDGNVTLYEDENVNEAASATLTFTLNSTAITDINAAISAGSTLPFMFISHDDFNNNIGTDGIGDPEGPTGFFTGELIRINTAEASTASDRPILSLTYGSAASGYGHKVAGVAAASIGKVKNVATANIGKVIGVD